MAAATGFAVSISSANCNVYSDTRLRIDDCINAQRVSNPSTSSMACFPPRTRGVFNNLRYKVPVPETRSFGLCPRCELASESGFPSKSSLSALEFLKTSAADRKFPPSLSKLFWIYDGFLVRDFFFKNFVSLA